MLHFRKLLPAIFLFLGIVLNLSEALCQKLSLKVSGDQTLGYRVDIYKGTQLLVTGKEELSLHLSNLDLSTIAYLPHWTGEHWEGNENRITLKKDSYIPDFDANLSVSVTYEVVN